MPVVDIESVGTVEFPDSMSQEDIGKASEQIYNQRKPATTRPVMGDLRMAEQRISDEANRTPEQLLNAMDTSAIMPIPKAEIPTPEPQSFQQTTGGSMLRPATVAERNFTSEQQGDAAKWWQDLNTPILEATPTGGRIGGYATENPEAVAESNRIKSEGTPLEKKALGVRTGAEEFLSGLTSPLSLGTLGVAGLLNKVPALSRVLSGWFAIHTGKTLAFDTAQELGREYAKPPEERDQTKLGKLWTSASLSAPLTAALGVHALSPSGSPLTTPRGPTREEHLQTLGLEPDATPEQIKTAFRNMAKEVHPDVNPSPDATAKFQEILAAYTALTPPRPNAGAEKPVTPTEPAKPTVTPAEHAAAADVGPATAEALKEVEKVTPVVPPTAAAADQISKEVTQANGQKEKGQEGNVPGVVPSVPPVETGAGQPASVPAPVESATTTSLPAAAEIAKLPVAQIESELAKARAESAAMPKVKPEEIAGMNNQQIADFLGVRDKARQDAALKVQALEEGLKAAKEKAKAVEPVAPVAPPVAPTPAAPVPPVEPTTPAPEAAKVEVKPTIEESQKGGESNASSQQSSTTVRSDVQPQPAAGEGKMPAPEGSGGIQPLQPEEPPGTRPAPSGEGKVAEAQTPGLTPESGQPNWHATIDKSGLSETQKIQMKRDVDSLVKANTESQDFYKLWKSPKGRKPNVGERLWNKVVSDLADEIYGKNASGFAKPVETPAKAEAKMQDQVSEVAKAEGTRPAKEIKSELVERLEKAIEKAPAQADLSEDQLKALKSEIRPVKDSDAPNYDRNSKQEGRLRAAEWSRNENAKRRKERDDAIKATGITQVEIDIPGDGSFTIWNTKEALTELLSRAKKLSTQSTAPDKTAFTKSKPTGNIPAEIWVESSEPTHRVTITAGIAKKGKTEGVYVQRPGKEITIKGHEGRKLFLTSDGKQFTVTEPRTGLSVGTGDTITKAIEDAQAKLSKSNFDKAVEDGVKGTGERPAPEPIVRESKPAKEPPAPEEESEGAQESRIDGKGRKQNVFEMEEGDLADLFNERFGEMPAAGAQLESRGRGEFTFPTYEAFRDWMDARYAERDIEGMRLAFAEADTKSKIGYIKENRAADAHKKAWITHLATGADLPKTDPPIARTTPRPNARGTTSPAPPGTAGTPPARPGAPTPPPRSPTSHRKFDIMALTQMFRHLGKYPVVNERLKRAYGRFVPATEAVELKKRLMWDTALAERVLGHEIGHFIDLAIPLIGKGKQLAQRLRPLFDFKGQMWQAKQLKDDARSLSRQWRGNFPNGDPYRDTANELFADFMSAMFNKPEWVNQTYPRLFDAFQEIRDAKPDFKDAYREVETWLQGETMGREWMDQQRAAVERTHDILADKPKESRASVRDRLLFSTLTLWQRAFEKEGKPRALGSSITEKLETSYLWAAKRLALWRDDFLKNVEAPLKEVSDDPVTARTHLLSFSQATRTIGERRAAGKWIEDNPAEARQILEKILDLDPSLRSKWLTALNSATDPQLYDLSAAIFREIHDRGEPFADRIGREIDKLDLGVDGEAALMAFNVRGKLLNPGGLTVENAQKVLDTLKDQLKPAEWTALNTAAKNLRDSLFDVQEEMHDAGLISDKTWKELIEPNKDNYVPYSVLDYFDGKVRAGVMQQKGTAKDIADIAAATQLKVASSYVWLQKQRQVQLLRDAEAIAQRGPVPVGRALNKVQDIDAERARHVGDDISRAVYWVNGRPHLQEFPGDPGKMLEKALRLPEFYQHMEGLHALSDLSHKVMQVYTQFSPRFLLYRNVIRGLRTGGLKVGFYNLAKHLFRDAKLDMKLARNYADAAFGGEMLPEVRALVENEVLPPPHLAAGMVRDLPHLRELIQQGAAPAYAARKLNPGTSTHTPVREAAHQVNQVTAKIFTAYEAFEKIYDYKAAKESGKSEETAAALARRGGIPRPGVAGKWSSVAEIFFPWTRVKMQGMRSTYDILRDPALRKGFLWRFALTEGAPRMAKVALALGIVAGLIKWLTGKDDDGEDSVMADFLKRVSPYKMALDDTVPLYYYDPRKGEVHYLWEFKKGKDVPKHYEAVSLRLPTSEEGITWGTALYSAMSNKQLDTPGQDTVDKMGQWVDSQLMPSESPSIKIGMNLYQMMLRGQNPTDPFRNQPAANPQLFEAGGMDRAQAIAGYTMNQLGGPGELGGIIAMNLGLLDQRAMDAMKHRLSTDKRSWDEKVPFLGAALSHDNYAQYRDEKLPEMEEKQLRARAKLVMTEDVRALYDFYQANSKRKDKMTDSELDQFKVAQSFVQHVWGTLTVKGEPNPDSFYSKTAHAVGPDGSRQARATVKRDLEQAAEPYISDFKKLRAQ